LLASTQAEGFDLAVIDAPRAVSFDTAVVAGAADLVIVPACPSILDILAVSGTIVVVKATKTPALLVLNACVPPKEAGEAPTTIEARKALEGLSVAVTTVSLA
jgi:cellulose biosynthesis protein BcsQ